MKNLFTPLKIKNLELRNRIVMAPMCMYSADTNGYATDWHFTHYETRAIGGVGLVMLEATAVESRGRISDHDLGIWNDDQIDGLKKIVTTVKKHGAKVGIQLAHAGRKCSVLSEDIIGPSPICFDQDDPSYVKPREMSDEDIAIVIESFQMAARRALEAGFDVIEIHGAHGYLINAFLSPLSNTRTDQYGISNNNGSSFLKKILISIKKEWPEAYPIFLRVSASDYHHAGNTPETLSIAINAVKEQGIDLINVSSGGVIPARVLSFDGYQLKFAQVIKNECNILVMAGGRIKSPQMADEVIRNDRADLIFMGRQLLIQPYWPIFAASELNLEIDYTPEQYARWK